MSTKIKTYEAACKALKLDAKDVPDVSALPENHRAAIIAHYKLVIIAEAINEGWKPDWNNSDEAKYYPWFEVVKKGKSGFGLSSGDCDTWHSYTTVGSRLCFKSRQLAEYAGKTFIKLYEDYMLFK